LPQDPTSYNSMMDWWEGPDKGDPTDAFEATGDNARESPYAQLYPRLCTKSNVFTVHWRVQVLHKARSNKPDMWIEQSGGKKGAEPDHVVAEQRGRTMIERYLPPNGKKRDGESIVFPDYATQPTPDALDDYYEYRVVNRRAFAP
jgi:hypothetical protein